MSGIFKSIILSFFIFCHLYAAAWGRTGHRAIAEIAYNQLNKNAKNKIEKILGDSYLPLFATYADDIRSESENPLGKLPHYVNMPFDESYQTSVKSENGDLVTILNEMINKVKDVNASNEEKAVALKFIIHLISG